MARAHPHKMWRSLPLNKSVSQKPEFPNLLENTPLFRKIPRIFGEYPVRARLTRKIPNIHALFCKRRENHRSFYGLCHTRT